MSIRAATEADLEAIVWIVDASTRLTPSAQYRCPLMDQYSEDYTKQIQDTVEENLAREDRVLMVYEVPSRDEASREKVVAVASWQLPGTHLSPKDGIASETANPATPIQARMNTSSRAHANAARVAAMRTAALRAKKEIFDERYGDNQLYLSLMGCHPQYQRREAGEMLCRWGLDKAMAESLASTCFGSPMGMSLYHRLGYEIVRTFRSQVEGEEEFFDTPILTLERYN